MVDQVAALENNDFDSFLKMVVESGYSSYMYNQNIFDVVHKDDQVVSLALALSEMVLKGKGAWRVHGGGFGGTIQDVTLQVVSDADVVLIPSGTTPAFIDGAPAQSDGFQVWM